MGKDDGWRWADILSDIDALEFKTLAINSADDCMCVTTAAVTNIALKIKTLRRKKSIFLLINLGSAGLINRGG